MPLPSILNGARQCQAKSKRSGNRCLNPAAYGCRTCRFHGAHRPQQAASGESHWNHQHGRATQKKRAEDAASATKLLLLRDLGNRLGMFGTQPTGWAGRTPTLYCAANKLSIEELIQQIELLDDEVLLAKESE